MPPFLLFLLFASVRVSVGITICELIAWITSYEINYFQGIPVAPLWDFCKAQFVGVLSALDFIMILQEVLLL